MDRYIALVDASDTAFGASFPDLPGCVAMSDTLDGLSEAATEALTAWVVAYEVKGERAPPARDLKTIFSDPEVREAIAEGAVTMAVPLVREARKAVKANLSLDAAILGWIDETADRAHMTRSGLIEALVRRHLAEFEL